jgi:hypothetical protein
VSTHYPYEFILSSSLKNIRLSVIQRSPMSEVDSTVKESSSSNLNAVNPLNTNETTTVDKSIIPIRPSAPFSQSQGYQGSEQDEIILLTWCKICTNDYGDTVVVPP